MNKLTTILVAAAVLAFSGCVPLDEETEASVTANTAETEVVVTEAPVTEPAATEPPVTEAPAVTEPPVTAPPALEPEVKEIPVVTEPAAAERDEFLTWVSGKSPEMTRISADSTTVFELTDSGDIPRAAALATEISDDYTDLYIEAPVTGTELSDVGNEMLLTCSIAYSTSADALTSFNSATIEMAAEFLDDCSGLLGDFTALISAL